MKHMKTLKSFLCMILATAFAGCATHTSVIVDQPVGPDLARPRIDHLRSFEHGDKQRLFLHYGDLADSVALVKLLYSLQPDEVYNLAAQSHVRVSFEMPEYTCDVNAAGVGLSTLS